MRVAPALLVVAFGAAGCGDGRSVDAPNPTTVAASTSRPVETTDTTRFRALANGVCSTVRSAWPAPLPASAEPAAVRRYAAKAAKGSVAMRVSLRRLPAPKATRRDVDQLARLYGQARNDYRVAARTGRDAQLLDALRRREAVITGEAQRIGLPACGGAAR